MMALNYVKLKAIGWYMPTVLLEIAYTVLFIASSAKSETVVCTSKPR